MWQPIETAPKDGTPILGYGVWDFKRDDGNQQWIYVIAWCSRRNEWIEAEGECYQDFGPTHWMPLPPYPTDSAVHASAASPPTSAS